MGKYPLSEPESRALCDFTLKVLPNMTISYHTKGEEIYWEFFQKGKRYFKDKKLALIASQTTGYPLKTVKGSCGGYKDWCIEKLKIPALTIEVGSDDLTHPIGLEKADEIFIKNKDLLMNLIVGLENL